MRILALDLALTLSGWARMDGEIASGVFSAGDKRGMLRLHLLLKEVEVLTRGVDLVVIEGYSFASKGRASISLGELGGLARYLIWKRNIPCAEVPPSCRAKFATGKGNSGKPAVLVEAVRRLGYEGHDNNEADALWLLQMALAHYGLEGAVTLPKVHLEALKKVAWPVMEEG